MDSLQRLFREVADLDPDRRSRYFDAHEVDEQMRRNVESLLRFDGGSADLLTGVVGATVEQFLNAGSEPFAGPYELVRLLGEGGMGSVHLAQRRDGEVDLRVAIKFIRGADSTLIFRNRFLQERQILARLNHPGITRLLDAGHTASGQPYLVMEYVDGVPIDIYCKDFGFEAKLVLFLAVCDAVAYLHRNLVIHRDLKPSNILVQADGSAKVLDFGIAKIIDDAADQGITKERMLTPDYASPEQVKGTATTTATDIYSVGAVLYALLTGKSPHATQTKDESVEERIVTAVPASVRMTHPRLPLDLDYVVRKALRKEPIARYGTVDALAEDLRAVLESRPVKARSGDASYRLRKFARRQWLPLVAAAAVILSLAAGLLVANRQKAVAEQRFAQLRQLSNRMLTLDNEIRELPGSTKAREHLVATATDYLDGLGSQAKNDPELSMEAAHSYMIAAEIKGVPTLPSLGKYKEAEAILAKAVKLVDRVLEQAPRRADALLLAAEIEQDWMIIASTEQDGPETLAHSKRAAIRAETLSHIPGVDSDQKTAAARILLNSAQGLMNIHRYPEAAPLISRSLDLMRVSGGPSGVIAQGLSLLANARRQSGDVDGALAAITEARKLSENGKFSTEGQKTAGLYAILWRQGLILDEDESISLNRPSDALEPSRKAFDIVDGQAAQDPNDVSSRDRVGTAGLQLGNVLRRSDPAAALAIYDRAIQRLREMKNDNARRQEARILANSSYVLRTLHRMPEAKQRIATAFEVLRPMGESPQSVGVLGGEWDQVMRASAALESEAGHPERALAILTDLRGKVLALKPDPENDLRHAVSLSLISQALAKANRALGRDDDARALETETADLWRRWDIKLPHNSFVQRQIKKALLNPIC